MNTDTMLDNEELKTAKTLVTSLLDAHWERILQTVEDNLEQASISIGIKLDHTKSLRLVKSRIAYAVKMAEEASVAVRDPNQLEIGI